MFYACVHRTIGSLCFTFSIFDSLNLSSLFTDCPLSSTGETEGGGFLSGVVSLFGILSFNLWQSICLHLQLFVFLNYRAKSDTYDDVVERVAQRLGVDDPSKIRLTPHNCYSQQPKPNPIKYRSVDHLVDMLIHYNQVC